MKNVNVALVKLTHAIVNTGAKSSVEVNASNYIKNGIIFVDKNGPVDKINEEAADVAASSLGLTWDVWNNTFHKTWEKIADADLEQLIMEQVLHYFSTYGFEALGLKASPYIPVEDILPEDKRPSCKRFTLIRVVSEEEAIDLINEYFATVQKPNALNMLYIKELAEVATISPQAIKSFEIKCIYCSIRGSYPKNNQDLLRYLVYSATNGTLLIKNNETVENIKRGLTDSKRAAIVHNGLANADLVELSKIFLRNKRIFLAFKADKRNAPIINKIRRLAVENHQPLSEISVANMMNLLAQGKKTDAESVIAKTSNRNLIKLINYANTNSDTHIYNIRNGKVYVNDKPINKDNMRWLYMTALKQLSLNLSGKLAGKEFYIPVGVDYKAPISEKQMIGNIPYGTTITPEADVNAICTAIAWDNYKDFRTDIDFHLNSATRQFGWNSSYRDGDAVLFSGDMTDAANGATEAYRFNVVDEPFLATASLYSGENGAPFKFFLTGAENFRERDDGMVDISKALIAPIPLKFPENEHSMSIGFMNGKSFTFYGGSLGRNIAPKADLYKNALDSIIDRVTSMISLKDIIEFAGGTIVNEIKEDTIDLSPENITETVIFSIVDGE